MDALIQLNSPVRARVAGRRLVSLLAALSLVAAISPAGAAAADVSAGYHATWTVRGPDAQPRTDGKIAVGDDLQVTYAAVDGTAITNCQIRLTSPGGWLMSSSSNPTDGACSLLIRLPDFPEPKDRAVYAPDSSDLDLCVSAFLGFADGQARQMAAADQGQPGGRQCYNGNSHDELSVLDFPIEPGGTPRAFVSDPPMLSWNPADWGTGMAPLTFGTPWHYQLPAWVARCRPYLNGSWTTVIRPDSPAGCAPWDLRLPGVLPSTLPWFGGAGDWDIELVSEYAAAAGQPLSMTITKMHAPMTPSDTVFESNPPAIFPVDLATTRFVTVGQPWQPVFVASGSAVTRCTLTVYTVPPTFPVDPVASVDYPNTDGSDTRCTFDVPAFGPNEGHQYYVNAFTTVGEVTYGGSVSSIPVPQPPTIEVPTDGSNGQTDIGVEPGEGQGLGLGVEVAPDLGASTLGGDVAATAVHVLDDVVCQDSALSSDLEIGGQIPHLDAHCGLAPGTYVATARMVDAAGVVTTSTRTFTVLLPRPRLTARMPAAGATGVARNIQPTATFDVPVTGVSGSTVRLRDAGTGTYLSATVSYDAASHRATLRPAALLGAGHTYRLYLSSGIQSSAGRPLVATSWTFKVSTDATRPTFVPVPGRSATGVSRTANVYLKFSERVSGVSGTTLRLKDATTGLFVAATVTYDSVNRRAIVNPSVTLRRSHSYKVVIRSGITDRAGNPLIGVGWSFTTHG
jgi:hypothetical protein